MRAHVEAYGCTLNSGEAGEVEDLLRERGWNLQETAEGADLVVVFTCVVIDKTERAMLKRLKQLSGAPRLVVTGCMATAYPEKAQGIAPHAALVPPGDLRLLSDHIEYVGGPLGDASPSENAFVIVPIATGCSGSCAYCITRLARGALKSRQASEVVHRVTDAVSERPKEVRLTAQDTASYGSDIGSRLPDLVSEICSIPHEFRVRVGMMNPASAYPIVDAISRMYEAPKVFRFLHLPVQSGSDYILSDMARGYTARQFLELVGRVRSRAPDISLSTDMIVGYPGETEEDHQKSLELVRTTAPDIVNVTRFSPRPGTNAFMSKNMVPGRVAKARSRELTKLRFAISSAKNKAFVGSRVGALATERGKNGTTIMRTDSYKQVVVQDRLGLGRFYEVDIRDFTPTYLVGDLRT